MTFSKQEVIENIRMQLFFLSNRCWIEIDLKTFVFGQVPNACCFRILISEMGLIQAY